MNVDDVVAERIAAARARIAAAKARRTTQAAARQAGLTSRYRTKIALLDAADAAKAEERAEPPADHTGCEACGINTPCPCCGLLYDPQAADWIEPPTEGTAS